MRARDLRSLGEEGLLRSIFRAFGSSRSFPQVVVGPGDDSAVLRAPRGRLLVCSQDDLVEGCHFERRWAPPEELAWKLLGSGLSDLAGMGDVRPLGCVISAGLPPSLPAAWYRKFLSGVKRASRARGVPVVGGNLARSRKIFFSICVFGTGTRKGILLRSGARPGHVLAGLGPLGEAGAGLDLIRKGRSPRWAKSLEARFWRPKPLFREAARLSRIAASMLDNSDGLLRSARIIAEESGVTVRVDLSGVPCPRALGRWFRLRGRSAGEHRLRSAEDYGLIFSVPRRRWPEARAIAGVYGLGEIKRRGRRRVELSGARALRRGFEHF